MLGGVLDDGVHGLFGGVAQRGEGAFQRPVVRDGGLREPRAVHVPEEVVLRADGRVDIGQYDSGAAHAAPRFHSCVRVSLTSLRTVLV